MDEQNKSGSVHSPIEDSKVPWGLKILVLVMFVLMVGTFVFTVVTSGVLNSEVFQTMLSMP